MGIVYRGLSPNLGLRLRTQYDLKYFVETGTLYGRTAEWACKIFDQVYTMEVAYKFYIAAGRNLRKYKNVQLFLGYSQEILPTLMAQIKEPSLIWLDAHWSKDLKTQKTQDTICPVIAELSGIKFHDRGHVILIDDVRLFGTESGWPSQDKVIETLKGMHKKVHIEDDVFVAVPT